MNEIRISKELFESLLGETQGDELISNTNLTFQEDCDFILHLIGNKPKKILDVCCGNGRLLIPLAKAGHHLTGFDIDEPSINEIRQLYGAIQNIDCSVKDAIVDDWGSGYDVVIIAGSVLFNIETTNDYKTMQEQFIRKAASALTPGGCLYIDYSPFAPNGRTLLRKGESVNDDGSIIWDTTTIDEDGNKKRVKLTKGSFDKETNILSFIRYIELTLPNGEVEKSGVKCVKHYADLEQIREWLDLSGFEIVHEYENKTRKVIDADSRTLILFGRKR